MLKSHKRNTECYVRKHRAEREFQQGWVPGPALEEAVLEPGPEELVVFGHTERRRKQREQGHQRDTGLRVGQDCSMKQAHRKIRLS